MEHSFTRLSPLFNYSTALFHNTQYLLIIDRAFNMESYRRIYFKDLQSLQIQKTISWIINAAVMGIVAGIFATVGTTIWFSAETNDDGLRVFAAVMYLFTGVFTAVMAKHIVLGATCKVYACTAVQRIFLPNISTLRKLKRFETIISPLINDVQGALPDSEMREELTAFWQDIRKKPAQGRVPPNVSAPVKHTAEVHGEDSATISTEDQEPPVTEAIPENSDRSADPLPEIKPSTIDQPMVQGGNDVSES